MILAELPALRETLINGAGGIKGSTEGDLFRTNICLKKQKEKCHSAVRCPSFWKCHVGFDQIKSLFTFDLMMWYFYTALTASAASAKYAISSCSGTLHDYLIITEIT